ncbi:MAG: histidine phosphatase family protein [Gammaproteobacteria bacterium CG11_big_fil_rev_8_21_14_0_20_46_22]|nr:MAG: histidine phosphatase family protein [Gammaproteobacteria bacterium CG12_big_fil_rev_8_21_14_0_65_46_12]PIR12118.1 MAG: histidine phosphatase family protein [Gammaproteobacteria bacterium CG11_big_fil_rev_8_21_14_0_20_46_22]
MRIFLVRHFETAWNAQGILQGAKDIPILGAPPHTLVSSVREKLKLVRPQKVFVSPLCRTQQTARLCGFEQFIIDVLLRELDFGQYEGKAKTLLQMDYGEQWLSEPSKLIFGESLANFRARILKFLIKHQEAEKMLIFGHGNWIRALISLAQYGHIDQMNQLSLANGEVVELNFTLKMLQELLNVYQIKSS